MHIAPPRTHSVFRSESPTPPADRRVDRGHHRIMVPREHSFRFRKRRKPHEVRLPHREAAQHGVAESIAQKADGHAGVPLLHTIAKPRPARVQRTVRYKNRLKRLKSSCPTGVLTAATRYDILSPTCAKSSSLNRTIPRGTKGVPCFDHGRERKKRLPGLLGVSTAPLEFDASVALGGVGRFWTCGRT